MLSKEASSTIFWVFGMTRPGIEPRSPGPLANTLGSQINMQCSLIREITLYKFELCHITEEVTKNICFAKGGATADYSTVSKWFKNFCSNCKSLNDQAKSDRSKTVDYEALFQASEANLVSSTRGELGISQSPMFFFTFTISASGAAELCLSYQNISKLLRMKQICLWMTIDIYSPTPVGSSSLAKK